MTKPRVASIALVAVLVGCGGGAKSTHEDPGIPGRIVTFAPSITETVFALGRGDRVVGVSKFCNYPKEAKAATNVGGFTDPNFEQLLRLKPDLVIAKTEHGTVRSFCEQQNISCLGIDNDQVDAIIRSIALIGEACGAATAADSITRSIRAVLDAPAPDGAPPSMLLCIDRTEPGSGKIASIFVAGPNTFYTDLIRVSGARNAYIKAGPLYPSLSVEGIVAVAPDIIVDITVNPQTSADALRADWDALDLVPAVKQGMVFCVSEPYMTIPGPRITLIVKRLRAIVAKYRQSHVTSH